MNVKSCSAGRGIARGGFYAALLAVGALLVGSVPGLTSVAKAAAATSYESLAPVGSTELAEMRGGFMLPNGMILNIGLTFSTSVSEAGGGSIEEYNQSYDEGDFGGTGVVHTVIVEPGDGSPVVEISTDPNNTNISGVMNVIQNNASSVAIQNMTTLNVDVLNSQISMQVFRANNFSMTMRGLGAAGL